MGELQRVTRKAILKTFVKLLLIAELGTFNISTRADVTFLSFTENQR